MIKAECYMTVKLPEKNALILTFSDKKQIAKMIFKLIGKLFCPTSLFFLNLRIYYDSFFEETKLKNSIKEN